MAISNPVHVFDSKNSSNLEKILNASLEKQNKLTAGDNITISDDSVVSADVPTKTSELENDSDFITSTVLEDYAKTEDIPTKTSELENDSDFITDEDLSDYQKKLEWYSESTISSSSGYVGSVSIGKLSSQTYTDSINLQTNRLSSTSTRENVISLGGSDINIHSNNLSSNGQVTSENYINVGSGSTSIYSDTLASNGLISAGNSIELNGSINITHNKLGSSTGLQETESFIKLADQSFTIAANNLSSTGEIETERSITIGSGTVDITTPGWVYCNGKKLAAEGDCVTNESLSEILESYATVEEVEEKQDKLSAGVGISIEDGTINVTLDTTLYKVVTELPNYPDYDDTNKIFLVPEESESEKNMFAEYIWVNENRDWEKIGDIETEIDLSDYVTNEELSETLESYTTNDSLTTALESYTTNEQLSETLESYTTNEQLSETLESYATVEYVDNNVSELKNEIATKQDKGTVYKTDSIENLPVTYDFIIVDLEASGTLTFESIPESGKKIDVYVKNVENGIEILSFPNEYEIMGSAHQSLIEYGVSGTLLHVFSDGEKVYISIEGSVDLPEPGTDILFWDRINETFAEVSKDKWNINDYPTNRYDPIGLIVIPREHDVYGTGECGILSLDYMSCETPETGTDALDCLMYWGLNGVDTSDSYKINLPTCGTISNPTDSVTGYTSDSAVGASDNFSGKQHPMNPNLYFHETEGTNNVVVPPFDSDGNKINDYSSYVENDGFGDFDGKGNTQKLLEYVTEQPDWKTDSTIINSSNSGYCPPACCCQRYYVDHTNPGDWYLPALGELGYVLAQAKAINNTIIDLDAEYGRGWATITTVKQHWSSTALDDSRVRTILMRTGGVNRIQKTAEHHARAMMRF